MTKVYLKFNNLDAMSITCLTFWIEFFKNDYELVLLCDKDGGAVNKLVNNHDLKLYNTNYLLTAPYKKLFKTDKNINCAAVNLTIFEMAKNDEWFWMIDADDTMFLTYNIKNLKEKIKKVEDLFLNSEMDGLSLDFYREFRDHWSFGVCLFRGTINYTKLIEIDVTEFKKIPRNLDGCFDILRKNNTLKLQSFVLDETMFIHTKSFKLDYVPNGVYYWENKKVWNTPLNPEVIII
jgi:hypothetical protein